MGMLAYARGVGSLGYKTESVGTAITQDIDPVPGARVSVHAFEALASTTAADKLAFMVSLDQTTTNGAVASAAATVVLTSALAPAGAAVAANDVVVFEMDDGTYHWTTVSSWTAGTLTMVVNDAFDDSMADNAKVWCLGVSADAGHRVFQLTSATTSTKEVDAGIFFGAGKGSPVRVHHPNATGAAGAINYVSYSLIEK